MGTSVLMDSPGEDPAKRIADLERQLEQQRRINELERELDGARGEPLPPGDSIDDLLHSVSKRGIGSTGWPPSGSSPRFDTSVDTRLSPAPRPVPLRFLLAEVLPFRWWYLTVMFLVAVPAAIVWAITPAAALPVAVVTLVVIYLYQFVGTRVRLQLLKWGQVATVVGTEIVSQASYYGGVTWYNAPLPIASRWRVSRPLWSGPSTRTAIRYTLEDYQGTLTVRGREYVDGIILADERRPDRAKCVTFFPYDLDRDDAGNWAGHLRPRLVLGMLIWLLIVIGWLTAATAITTGYATRALQHAQMITIEAGNTAKINGSSLTRQVVCRQGNLIVDGNENAVTITGHCTSLTVDGIKNTVVVDDADTIAIDGIDNRVTYHFGQPKITNGGIRNDVTNG